jgi:hypothetical protein
MNEEYDNDSGYESDEDEHVEDDWIARLVKYIISWI